MVTRRSARPLSSFLLRVTEERTEQVELRYELHELRTGRLHRFSSLAALARFIAARRRADPRPPHRPKKRK
jgi:hypothetical protein